MRVSRTFMPVTKGWRESVAKKQGRKTSGRSAGRADALGDFAEDLGRILGSAEHKARGWLDQRKSIAQQLTRVRDSADQLLRQLSGSAGDIAAAVSRATRRGRPPGGAAKTARKRSGRTFTAAQRKEQAERMRKYWAERKANAGGKKRGRKSKRADTQANG